MKKIGLIGGGGAFASQNILKYILELSVQAYHVTKDEEFPDIILHNIPFQGFDKEAHLNPLIFKQLQQTISIFDFAKCDLIAIACNTLHSFIPLLEKTTNIPFYNLLNSSAIALKKHGFKEVGILCSETSSHLKLHEPYLKSVGIKAVYLSVIEQKKLDDVIGKIILNNHTKQDMLTINEIIYHLRMNGCDGIFLGCTELSLLDIIQEYYIVDSSYVLANDLAQFSILS